MKKCQEIEGMRVGAPGQREGRAHAGGMCGEDEGKGGAVLWSCAKLRQSLVWRCWGTLDRAGSSPGSPEPGLLQAPVEPLQPPHPAAPFLRESHGALPLWSKKQRMTPHFLEQWRPQWSWQRKGNVKILGGLEEKVGEEGATVTYRAEFWQIVCKGLWAACGWKIIQRCFKFYS